MSATSECQEERAGSSRELFKGRSSMGPNVFTQHSCFAANVLPPPLGDSQGFWSISQRPRETLLHTRIKKRRGQVI